VLGVHIGPSHRRYGVWGLKGLGRVVIFPRNVWGGDPAPTDLGAYVYAMTCNSTHVECILEATQQAVRLTKPTTHAACLLYTVL